MAYFKLVGLNGQTHRIQLRQIKNIQPLHSALAINVTPIGATLTLKDGTEIDLNISVDDLRRYIQGW